MVRQPLYDGIDDLSELDQTSALELFAQDPAKQRQKANNLSARIYASNINIEASKFENINPYFVVNEKQEDWSDENWSPTGGTFDPMLMTQVSVIAEHTMIIKANKSVYNVSAILGQETVDSRNGLTIVTPHLENRRYMAHDTIDYTTENTRGNNNSITQRWVNEKNRHLFSSGYLTYSPPAYMYAHGPFTAKHTSSNAEFTNNTSYFTAYNDAYLEIANVTSIGDQLSKVDFAAYIAGFKRYKSNRDWNFRDLQYSFKFIKIQDKDAMFIIYGDTNAPTAKLNIETNNSMANVLDEALQSADYDKNKDLHDFADLFEENYFQNTLEEINGNEKVASSLVEWSEDNERVYSGDGVAPSNRPNDPYWKLAHSLRNYDYLDPDESTQAIIATEYGQETDYHKDSTVKGNQDSRIEYLHNAWYKAGQFFQYERLGEYLHDHFTKIQKEAVDLAKKVGDWFSNLFKGA